MPTTASSRPWAASTVAVHAGRPPATPDAPVNTPPVLSSVFHAGGVSEYARSGNPTWSALEEAVGALEGGRALAFASGMAAVAAVVELVGLGGRVVAPRSGYSGTRALLAERAGAGRLELVEVDVADPAAVAAAAPGAALVWLESLTNPLLQAPDVAGAAEAAHDAGALLAVDATFATPLRSRPLADGADIVVHSATKLIAGHSDVLAGLVVVRDEQMATRLAAVRTATGGILGPVEAWLVLRGLRTLGVRLDRAEATAATLARRLADHPVVARVRYPGWGSVVSVELDGAPAADAMVAGVRLWLHATSLGGVESTLERRARWSAESPDVPPGLVRLSVGVEDAEDLWADLAQALDAVAGGIPG